MGVALTTREMPAVATLLLRNALLLALVVAAILTLIRASREHASRESVRDSRS